YFGSAAISLANVIQDPTLYPDFKEGKEYKTEEGSPALRRVENAWGQNSPVSWWVGSSDQGPANNPHITDTTATLLDTSQVSAQHYDYDQYNNKTTVKEYDYGSGAAGSLIRCTSSSFLASGYDTVNPNPVSPDPNSTAHLRSLVTNQSIFAGNCGTGLLQAQTQYGYDTGVIASSGATQHDASLGTSYTTRGNVTAVQRWLNGTWLTTSHQYDDAGNVVRTIDPLNNSTTFSYADMWGNSGCAPSSGNAAAYRTASTTPATPNVPGGLVTHYSYDSCRGKPLSTTDPNGQVTTLIYEDLLDRLTQIIRAYGKPIQNRTLFSYDDTNLIVTTQSDQFGYQDGALKSETVYDGLGRVSKARQYETASNYIVVDTTYDAMGRKHSVSNPHRLTPSATDGITTYGYDALSRVRTVTAPDGSVTNSTYWGTQTTVWDPANKQRRSTTDALGRLTQVEEMQEYPSTAIYATTTYGYDALDDLTTVNQGGSGGQYRTFNYDSLKRLTSAINPESGTTLYPLYDGNGNLMTKTDARGVTTHYTYDALNRIQTKSYDIPQGSGVAPTSPVWYCYDTATKGVGRARAVTLGSSCTGDGTYYDAYDEMGRITTAHQVTDGQTYGSSLNPSYEYNLAGELTAETYPSGRKVSTGYDPAGRVNAVTGQKSGETNKSYAAMPNYTNFWPHGAVQTMNLGNGLVESAAYNNRLQPTQISLGNLASFGYTYETGTNNGNVQSQTISAPGLTLTQTYGYDWLNRLTRMNETSGWSETFSYDPYGNRTGGSSSSAYMPLQIPTINAQTNKISAANHSYDAVGNLTQGLGADGLVKAYTYDADNRLVTFNGSAATYSYDGDGRRVKKVVGSATTVLVYDARGQMVAE
ncbi:MAG: hypothetical protein WBN92_20160, partial [Terriglobia bacterium]